MSPRIWLGLLLAWLCFLIYLGAIDADAALVSLVLTPPFTILLHAAFKSPNLLLRAFVCFSFIAHAVGAPLFFVARYNYTFSGWGAVQNFAFEPVHLFQIYATVLACLALIVMFTIAIDLFRLDTRFVTSVHENASAELDRRIRRSAADPRATRVYSAWLIGLLLLVGLPLNWLMYVNNIGILGTEAVVLPYRLTGLSVYTRLFFLPLAVFWLYTKSSRGVLVTGSVIAYAFFAGLSSASRTVYLLPLVPIVFTALAEKRHQLLLVTGALALAGFFLVTASRATTYTEVVGYGELLVAVFRALLEDERASVMTIIGGISNRLYGAQDMVLAYQFEPREPWSALLRYFMSGGRSDAVVPDLAWDLYGIRFEAGSGFGLGLGILAYLVMLAHSSLARLVITTFVVALLLSVGRRAIEYAARQIFGAERSLVIPMVAGLVTMSLYSSSLNFFYIQVWWIFAVAFAMKWFKRFRLRPARGLLLGGPL